MLTSQLWSEGNHNSRTTTLWLEPIARVIKCTKKWSAPSDQMAKLVHRETLWSRIGHIDQIRILHDDRWGKGSVHHVDYIWLASTRLGAGAMKQVGIVVIVMLVKTLPAICIFWRSGSAGYPGWEVARLLVLVLRLLKTMSSNIHSYEEGSFYDWNNHGKDSPVEEQRWSGVLFDSACKINLNLDNKTTMGALAKLGISIFLVFLAKTLPFWRTTIGT